MEVRSHQGPSNIIQRIRTVLLLLSISAIAFPALYQPFLSVLWSGLRASSVYRWSTFETLWTVFWYAAVEVPMTAAFIKHPEWRLTKPDSKTPRTQPKGMRRPARRGYEALVYIAPLLLMDLTMIKKFAHVPLDEMLRTGNYEPAMNVNGRHQPTFLIPSFHNFSLSSPLQTERALPIAAPSSRQLVLELVVSMVIYDAVFFLFHLAMHTLPVLRSKHIAHHAHGDMHPQITNQLDIVERLGLVLLANFSLNIIGAHVLTRTLFVPVFVGFLVDIHSGFDSPIGLDKILPEGWAGGSRKHAKHHKDGGGGYEPFFCWCDDLWDMLQSPRLHNGKS